MRNLSSNFPSCERNGVDQGLHNVIIHYKFIDEVKIWKQKLGSLVAHLQSLKSIVREGDVLNYFGETVSIVHQYDRNKQFEAFLFSKVFQIF